MSDRSEAAFSEWQPYWVAEESRAGRLTGYTAAQFQEAAFIAGFAAGESENKSALDLMSSLAINPAIPYEFRAMMRTALGEPPLSPWEAP